MLIHTALRFNGNLGKKCVTMIIDNNINFIQT